MKNRIIKRVEACVLAGLLLFMSGVATLPVMAADDVEAVVIVNDETEIEDTETEEFEEAVAVSDESDDEDADSEETEENIADAVVSNYEDEDSDEELDSVEENSDVEDSFGDDGLSQCEELPPDGHVEEMIAVQSLEADEEIVDLGEKSEYILSDAELEENANAQSTMTVIGDLIDMTGAFTGEEATHNCSEYLKQNYDENSHWKECAICEKHYEVKNHNFTTMGNDSCVWHNSGETRICQDCGYKTVYKRPHVNDTSKWCTRVDAKYHYYKCTYCESYGSVSESCRDANGNEIKCGGGTCATCGYEYKPGHTYYNSSSGESGTVICHKCGVELIKFDNNSFNWTSDNSGTASIRITWWNSDIFGNDANEITQKIGMGGSGGGTTGVTTDLKAYASGGYIYASCIITYPYQEYKATWANQCWSIREYSTRVFSPVTDGKIENKAPTIIDAKITLGNKNGDYATKATLSATCTDNWNYDPNYVQIRLVDAEKNAISKWITCNRNNDQYSQNIDIVAEVTGAQTIFLQARDAGGNLSEKPITITNLDSKAPTITSALVTNEEWSKMKTITFTCIDEGAGDVYIAFNNQADYKKADYADGVYSRTYTFTGDVYGSVKAAVYFKDKLGNVTTEFVEICNLDNTCPKVSMTNVTDAFNSKNQAYGWNIAIEGTDTNDRLSKEGGGIVKYALSKSTKQPVSTAFVNNASLLVGQSGTYYVWVMDAAGNVAMADNPVTLHSDLHFNGCEVSRVNYNGKQLKAFYYNGKRIRL